MNAVSPWIQKALALLILVFLLGAAFNVVWFAVAHRAALQEEILFLERRRTQLLKGREELAALREELTRLEAAVERDPALAVFADRKEADELLHKRLRDLARTQGLLILHLRPGSADESAGPVRAEVRLRGREAAALAFLRDLVSGAPQVLPSRIRLSLQQQTPNPANTMIQVELDVRLFFRAKAA